MIEDFGIPDAAANARKRTDPQIESHEVRTGIPRLDMRDRSR